MSRRPQQQRSAWHGVPKARGSWLASMTETPQMNISSPPIDAKQYLDIMAVDINAAFRSPSPSKDNDVEPWVEEDDWSHGFLRLRDRIMDKVSYARLMLFSPLRLKGRKNLTYHDEEYFLNCVKQRRKDCMSRPLIFIAYDTATRLLAGALIQDSQKPSREQIVSNVKFGVIFLGAPKQSRLPPAVQHRLRHTSFLAGQGEDVQFQLLRAELQFEFHELSTWRVKPGASTGSSGLTHTPSGLSETYSGSYRSLKEYEVVYEKLDRQIRKLRRLFVYEGARCGDASFVNKILKEDMAGVAEDDMKEKIRIMTKALFLAIENDHAEVVDILLHGDRNVSADVEMTTERGSTPLAVAAQYGFVGVVKILLKAQANINCRDHSGKTPLMIACERGHLNIVKLFLRSDNNNKTNLNIDDVTPLKQTALMLSAKEGHIDTVQKLLSMHAKTDIQDSLGRTALIWSCENGQIATAQLLLQAKADVDAQRLDRATSLHIATSTGNDILVEILLRGGADHTILNEDNKTASSLATSENILKLLLGAQVYEECTKLQPDLDTIESLLKQEADIGYQGPEGKTALEVATDSKNEQVQKLLENPPLTNGPLSYIDQRSSEKLQWPASEDDHGCPIEVHGEIIDFHVEDGKEKRLRARPGPALSQMIYRGRGGSTDQLISKRYTRGLEARFRYYHLPANNLTWIKDLLVRLALEQHANRDAQQFEEMLGRLLTTRDWRHMALDYSRADKSIPFLRPQAASVKHISPCTQQAEENILFFMPYLHYDSYKKFEEMSDVMSSRHERVVHKETHITERIVHSYLYRDYPLHPRRTLDQFYYSPLDTSERDRDQVVYRYTNAHQAEPKIFMVDQLWIWILNDGKTLLTSFPRQWKIKDEDRHNPRHDVQKTDVMSSILTKLSSHDRPEIHSAYEMAAFIANQCFGTFFDPTRGLGESLQFLEFFERSIGKISDKETTLFHDLRNFLEMGHYDLREDRSSRLEELLDISREVILLDEIKDIRDELSIIDFLFDQQIRAVSDMIRILEKSAAYTTQRMEPIDSPAKANEILSPVSSIDAVGLPQRPRYTFEDLLSSLQQNRERIKSMDDRALRIYNDLQGLLDLKQKQASVFEAETARKTAQRQAELLVAAAEQAKATNRQGNTLMVFTLTTVVFLPASFMAAFFAIQIDSFPKANGQLDMPLMWVSKYIVIVTLAISGPLILLAFYVNSIRGWKLLHLVGFVVILLSPIAKFFGLLRRFPRRFRRSKAHTVEGTSDNEDNFPAIKHEQSKLSGKLRSVRTDQVELATR